MDCDVHRPEQAQTTTNTATGLSSKATLLLAAIICGLLLLVQLYRPHQPGMWFAALFDVLHAPVFSIIAICLLGLSSRYQWSAARRIFTVLAASVLIGIISEAAQIPIGRDASMQDLITDMLGAAAGLFLALAFGWFVRLPVSARLAAAVAGLVALMAAVWPMVAVSGAYAERYTLRPVLFDPGARYANRFVIPQNAHVMRERGSYRMTLGRGPWPGLIFHDLWHDWSGYSTLLIEIGNPATTELTVNIRVHDRRHEATGEQYRDRYNVAFELQTGKHTLQIPLEKIRNAPENRRMDMTAVEGVVIFFDGSNAGRELTIGRISLK